MITSYIYIYIYIKLNLIFHNPPSQRSSSESFRRHFDVIDALRYIGFHMIIHNGRILQYCDINSPIYPSQFKTSTRTSKCCQSLKREDTAIASQNKDINMTNDLDCQGRSFYIKHSYPGFMAMVYGRLQASSLLVCGIFPYIYIL